MRERRQRFHAVRAERDCGRNCRRRTVDFADRSSDGRAEERHARRRAARATCSNVPKPELLQVVVLLDDDAAVGELRLEVEAPVSPDGPRR